MSDYRGVSLRLDSIDDDVKKLDTSTKYIIKVDEGEKKRGKRGLVRLNVATSEAAAAVRELSQQESGFSRFIAEPMYVHDDDEEQYISIERVRGGWRALYSPRGGVAVEDDPASVTKYDDLSKLPLPQDFVQHLIDVMNAQHMSFVEVNPLIVRDNDCVLLDAAVLVDSAGEAESSWGEDDIVNARMASSAEQSVAKLNENSSASFSLRVLNPDAPIWLLLSGGGASICIADEAANRGRAGEIGNYGEYSGGPTGEETEVYTEAVLGQMFESQASRKALIIAGGVANFTDVAKTFGGIIKALDKNIDQLKKHQTKVFIRRGGPNEQEGLAKMKKYLEDKDLLGSVHGSGDVLTVVVDEALEYIDA